MLFMRVHHMRHTCRAAQELGDCEVGRDRGVGITSGAGLLKSPGICWP